MFDLHRPTLPPIPTPSAASNPLPGKALALVTPLLGVMYLVWRVRSLPGAPWLAALTLAAEVYLFGIVLCLAAAVWRASDASPAEADTPLPEKVDVFILAGDEEPPLLAASLRAAIRLRHISTTYVLDAVPIPARAALTRSYGCEYVALPQEPHEAGDEDGGTSADGTRDGSGRLIAAALARGAGTATLLLRAGQVPAPQTMEYALPVLLRSRTGFVQLAGGEREVSGAEKGAPLRHTSLDALGQGLRSLWGAARLEGAATLFRREALLELSATLATRAEARHVLAALAGIDTLLANAATGDSWDGADAIRVPLEEVRDVTRRAAAGLRSREDTGAALALLTGCLDTVREELAGLNVAALRRELGLAPTADVRALICGEEAAPRVRIAHLRLSPLASLGAVQILGSALALAHAAQGAPCAAAVPVAASWELPASTLVLHALGWRSVYLPEPLVQALAPEGRVAAPARPRFALFAAETRRDFARLPWGQRACYLADHYIALWPFAAALLALASMLTLLTGAGAGNDVVAAQLSHLLPYAAACALLVLFLAFANGVPVGRLGKDLRTTTGGVPSMLALALHWHDTTGRVESGAALETVRGEMTVLVLLVCAVAIGSMRLHLGLTTDLDDTLVAAADALAYAWMLWAPVGAALAVQSTGDHAPLARTSAQGAR